MNLDATTFGLEIVNFLVLLWLLWRFFFKPVQATLAQREADQAAQVQALNDREAALQARQAELDQRDAQALSAQDAQRQALAQELNAERARQMQLQQTALHAEREKAQAQIAERMTQAQAQADALLQARAARFVAGYLARVASPAVESALMQLFLQDLAQQAPSLASVLQREGQAVAATDASAVAGANGAAAAGGVLLETAFPVEPAMQHQVEQALRHLLGRDGPWRWQQSTDVLAGLSVHLPGHLLETSLRRGVDAFHQQQDTATVGA
jgi:F-type H+-transporting ATPase subunit b